MSECEEIELATTRVADVMYDVVALGDRLGVTASESHRMRECMGRWYRTLLAEGRRLSPGEHLEPLLTQGGGHEG